MQQTVIALLHDPWPDSFDSGGSLLHRTAARFRKSIHSRANPRDAEYMRALCKERWGDAAIIEADKPGAPESIQGADIIVILYPDAIGQGFANLESEIARHKSKSAEIRVLNGRRRDFPLSPSTLRGLRLRRFLERTMLAEWLFLVLFLFITPVLLLLDWARGRR
jgi:hypothetical protein